MSTESVTVRSAVLRGVTAEIIEIRVDSIPRPVLEIEGLPEAAARETRVRVRSALAECGVSIEGAGGARVVFPTGVALRGQAFDLPIALGIEALRRGHEIPGLVIGELSLSGEVRAVRGVLPALEAASAAGLPWACIPHGQSHEVDYGPPALPVYRMRHLGEPKYIGPPGELLYDPDLGAIVPEKLDRSREPDLADVAAMHEGRRALELAVATGQNLLLIGPPGAGKTMLARRAPSIMRDPTTEERRQLASIASAAGLPATGLRPFRAPHHTASTVAIVGGGDPCRPGEVTLAHGGVLFLDELPELTRASIEALRAVSREGRSVVARADSRIVMPARPLIIGAMNPCPCGYAGSPNRQCSCSPARIEAYWARVAPLREIFPLAVRLDRVAVGQLGQARAGETSAEVRERIATDGLRATTLANDAPRFAWSAVTP